MDGCKADFKYCFGNTETKPEGLVQKLSKGEVPCGQLFGDEKKVKINLYLLSLGKKDI